MPATKRALRILISLNLITLWFKQPFTFHGFIVFSSFFAGVLHHFFSFFILPLIILTPLLSHILRLLFYQPALVFLSAAACLSFLKILHPEPANQCNSYRKEVLERYISQTSV
jgi:hypothetical protein